MTTFDLFGEAASWQGLVGVFGLSLCVAVLLVLAAPYLPRLNGKPSNLGSVQAAHGRPTPRVGGVCIFLSVAAAVFLAPEAVPEGGAALLLSAGLLFFSGLMEDLGVDIRPRLRLLMAATASLCAVLVLGTWLPRLNIPYVDGLLSSPAIGVPVTLFVTVSVANGFNFIDGVNGLSGFTAIIAALVLAGISAVAGQPELGALALILAAAVCGFFAVNYPFGRLFLGDAGAYTLGFFLSWIGVLLLSAAPEVSAWAVLLTVYWPLFDTILAVVRRTGRARATMAPDRLHAHHLVMRSLEILVLGRGRRHLANPLTTLVLAPFVAMPPLAGLLLWNKPLASFLAALLFLGLYAGAYLLLGHHIRTRERYPERGPRATTEGQR